MPDVDQKKILENRLKQFALNIVKVARLLPKTEENKIYTKQLLRSSSSIGANYAEALFAQTRQEFLHCISISRKEANESIYWLDMLYNVNTTFNDQIEMLTDEGKQILKIFISSVKTTKLNLENSKSQANKLSIINHK